VWGGIFLRFPKKKLSALFPFSWRDLFVSVGILFLAAGLCILLQHGDTSDGFASPIFILAVLLVSHLTTGYLFGLIASVISVICVNLIFTFPYWAVNFALTGYPLTFIAMLAVSIVTSALTTQLRDHERLQAETEKEKLRANLLRAISHDIRTPLTSIVGSVSVLQENGDKISDEMKKEMLGHIQEEAQWLITMVENLLSITRISDGGSARISCQPEVLEEVVGGAVQKFRGRHGAVRVVVEIPEQIVLVSVDSILIEQVLINILENAVVHGKNTTEIRVSILQDEEYATVVVRDNGGGVDSGILPHILEDSYAKIRDQHTDNRRNMGIGLSVCRSIIAAHDGAIAVCNIDGGAEFSIKLPLEKEENEEVDELV